MAQDLPVVIVGGGLAGALAALCLARRHPDLPLLLIEAGPGFGGNHTWSFFDSDVPNAARDLVAALEPVRWPRHRVHFTGREREFAVAYNSVGAEALDALIRARLRPDQYRLNASASHIGPTEVTLARQRVQLHRLLEAKGAKPCSHSSSHPDDERFRASLLDAGWARHQHQAARGAAGIRAHGLAA